MGCELRRAVAVAIGASALSTETVRHMTVQRQLEQDIGDNYQLL